MKRLAQLAGMTAMVLLLLSCQTYVRRTAIEAPLSEGTAIGVTVRGDNDGALLNSLYASMVEQGFRPLMIVDETAVPEDVAVGRFHVLNGVAGQIQGGGSATLSEALFTELLDATSFDSSQTLMTDFRELLSAISQATGIQVLLVVETSRNLTASVFAYDAASGAVLGSYFVTANNGPAFLQAIPAGSQEDNRQWVVPGGSVAADERVRAVLLADDIVSVLAGNR